MRVLHFSDIHVGLGLTRVPVRDWPGKRLVGGANLLRGRGRRFEGALEKLSRLTEVAGSEDVDLVVFSGDFTAMGTDAEFSAARAAIEPILALPAEFVCVPGNHDIYARDVVLEKRFEKHFGDLLETDLPQLRVDGPWPLVRFVGEDDGGVVVIALNSARPNPVPPWRSSGRIPDEQLEALGQILRRPELGSRFVFVVTHYAPRLWDGRPDTPNHRLVNAEAFIETCAGIERSAILCGHVHRTYRVQIPGIGPEIFCAGSATMHELEGFWMFDLERGGLSARRGRWNGHGYEVDAPGDGAPSQAESPG